MVSPMEGISFARILGGEAKTNGDHRDPLALFPGELQRKIQRESIHLGKPLFSQVIRTMWIDEQGELPPSPSFSS